MPTQQGIEEVLVAEVSQRKGGIEAEELVRALNAKGYETDAVRGALVKALNRGMIRLGRDLRFAALEPA